MKYELISSSLSPEIQIDNNTYKVIISLYIHPIDGIAPNFLKELEVISNNAQTGFEVDIQRQQEIQDYLSLINQ